MDALMGQFARRVGKLFESFDQVLEMLAWMRIIRRATFARGDGRVLRRFDQRRRMLGVHGSLISGSRSSLHRINLTVLIAQSCPAIISTPFPQSGHCSVGTAVKYSASSQYLGRPRYEQAAHCTRASDFSISSVDPSMGVPLVIAS